MRIIRIVLALILISVCALSAKSSEEGFRTLFNGKNFDGWYLKIRSGDEELAKKVFTVTKEGWVHVFGDGFQDGHKLDTGENDTHGLMYYDEEFSNFILRFEYKWGAKRTNNFTELQYDAGCYYHVYWDKVWPHGLEYQIRYDHTRDDYMTGDYWAAGTQIQWYGDENKRFLLPSEGGKAYPLRPKGLYRNKVIKNHKGLSGEWNYCEVIAMNNKYCIHKLNGEIVNMATDMSESKGKIGFQSETAEVFYRNIRLKELKPGLPISDFISGVKLGY